MATRAPSSTPDADVEAGREQACTCARAARPGRARRRARRAGGGAAAAASALHADEDHLGREHEHAVRLRRHQRERRGGPGRPAPPAAVLERAQEQEQREHGREEEQAVHAAVDAVVERRPARRGEQRRDSAVRRSESRERAPRSPACSPPRTRPRRAAGSSGPGRPGLPDRRAGSAAERLRARPGPCEHVAKDPSLTKNTSVSSSCGGSACRRRSRKTARPTVIAATPSTYRSTSARARCRAVRGALALPRPRVPEASVSPC